MRIIKRMFASILTIAIALGDCGSMAVFAEETAVVSENSISENDTETPETTEAIETPEITELPALQIGWISDGETFPSADDTFSYNLPVSFETSNHLILFTNYTIEAILKTEDGGSLEWSILRGEKGITPGSASLLNTADDWNGFAAMPVSPYFTMENLADAENESSQMIALTAKESAFVTDNNASGETEDASETYDYYIRATYYPETENGESEILYAAATIPFVPQDHTAAKTDVISEDAPDMGNTQTNPTQEPISVSENTAEHAVDTISENSPEDASSASENEIQDTAENTETKQPAEAPSTLSENTSISSVDEPQGASQASQDTDAQESSLLEETDSKIILYQGIGTDDENILTEKERIPMAPKDTLQITATIEPAMTPTNILWESGDETVATVTSGANGTATITAKAEGYAKITASCNGITASAVIDVVPDKANPDYDKLLDLSGEIRVAGFEKESDDLVYNGQKITQNFRVYHKNTLLTEKTDYTLNYKNNINAAAWNSAKAPSVTINLKGQYQGSVTLYYTIKPLNINDIDIYNTPKVSPAYEQTVNYSKKLNIPAPVLNYGKKKLAVNKDFICDYATPGENMTPLPTDPKSGDLYEPGKTYSYTVRGTGNFTGSFPMQLVVLNNKELNFGNASVKLDQRQYEYHGTPLQKQDVHIMEVKISGKVLSEALYDYTVYASGTEGAYVMLSPTAAGKSEGYCGCKKITLKLVGDRQLKDAVAGTDWKESILFSQKTVDKEGGIFQKGTALLAYEEGEEKKALTEGTDYTVKYGNAKKAGRVTVTFTGKGRYKGTLRLTYTVAPNTEIKIFAGKNVVTRNGSYEVAYQKGGALPELILKDQEYTVLKNKTDYAIKYKDNQALGTMTCEITGKGNYKGYQNTVTLTVTKADISQCTISVPDKAYNDKPNKWQSTVTIWDVNGKKLTAGKDYSKTFTFSHKLPESPREDTAVTVTVDGMGFYEGSSITGSYRIFAKNISALKVVIDPQEYTGETITLTPVKDIHIYANNADANKKQNEIMTSCYEIVEYKNNIKSGNAQVTLRGIGDYGGTKTYFFKIQKKKYRINHVKGIKLDKTVLSLPLAESDEEKRMLTATITSETDETIANPTIIWSSSNSSIVAVEEKTDRTVIGSADGKQTVSISAVLTLNKEGSATITATTQDGNKKAQCKVSVIDSPVLTEAGQTVQAKINETYQLHIVFTETQDPSKLRLTSNNQDAISVSPNEEGALLTMKKAGAAVITAVYTSGNRSFTQECYALAIDPNEKAPEPETGALLTYNQQEGVTDDTPYINKMLRDYEWGDESHIREVTLYIPAGVYHIDVTAGGNDIFGKGKFGGIVLTTNQKLVMSPSTLLMALPTGSNNPTQVIYAFGRDNVTISGGQIIGERKTHTGNTSKYDGHGIRIAGCTNVTIENVEISQCWGDGIWLGLHSTKVPCDGVTITNCNLHHNRRNNLSITDASNITVEGSAFNYASGIAPQYGIDIEPGESGYTCRNVRISNSTFKGNAVGTIQILGQKNAHINGVTIENCKGDKAPVIWQGFGGSVNGVNNDNSNNWNWK